MKSFCRKRVVSGLFFTFFCLLSLMSVAQVGDPVEDPGGDPDAPIDGGVGFLVAAGIGYGVKKFREKRKNNLGDSTCQM